MKKKNSGSDNTLLNKCLRCGSACCRYISVRIPGPRSMLDYDNLIWQLSHKNIKAFKDYEGWFLLIGNECTHLTAGGKCAIYAGRPLACRDYSARSCEFDTPLIDVATLFFDGAASLAAYCRKKFKNWGRRFE